MTLRARLLLAVAVLLAAALIVSGGLVIGITRASLVDQLDRDLRTATGADISAAPGPGNDNDPTGRRFALLIYDANEELVQALPAGLPTSPDSLPLVPTSGPDSLPTEQIIERPSVDGSLSYRVLALRGQFRLQPVTLILAAPMRSVEQSIGVLTQALIVVGLVVLALIVAVGWFIIRRDLRPLEQMTATAERISDGDLGQRAGMPDDGSEVGRLGHAFDIMLDQIQAAFESQNMALQAKERSETKLRQFVADASHELRTPLTSLRGYAELYRAGGLSDGQELEQAMARIGSESRRMAALVEDMLLLARLDQGRPLRHEPIALTELVNDAIHDLRAIEPARPIEASVEQAVVVIGDEDRLRQVIGNLVTNVRVHTPAEAPLEIGLAAREGVAELRVADHGPGIDPGHVEHIFDRFYRADMGRTRDRGGSGLGLAIAASVAAAHGGQISYSSTPGGGSTFTLTLPHG